MARSRDDHLWTLVHAERSSLAEDLSILDAEQWRHGTLCRQWDVEDVVAHLTAAGSLNQWRWVRSMLGAGFRTDVHNQRRMVERKGSTPAETLDRFRSIIDNTTAPSGHTPAYVGEVIVHAQDIRQPLGYSVRQTLTHLHRSPTSLHTAISPFPARPRLPDCSSVPTMVRLPPVAEPSSPAPPLHW